jgi:hypothetical protein
VGAPLPDLPCRCTTQRLPAIVGMGLPTSDEPEGPREHDGSATGARQTVAARRRETLSGTVHRVVATCGLPSSDSPGAPWQGMTRRSEVQIARAINSASRGGPEHRAGPFSRTKLGLSVRASVAAPATTTARDGPQPTASRIQPRRPVRNGDPAGLVRCRLRLVPAQARAQPSLRNLSARRRQASLTPRRWRRGRFRRFVGRPIRSRSRSLLSRLFHCASVLGRLQARPGHAPRGAPCRGRMRWAGEGRKNHVPSRCITQHRALLRFAPLVLPSRLENGARDCARWRAM